MCEHAFHDPRTIRNRWEALLANAGTLERDWQRFFEEYPCALARSLPLAPVPLTFKPLARPGKREADFYFYEENPSPFPIYGMIELKTSQTRLISTERRGFPVLSTAVQTGIAQLDYYARVTLPSLIVVPRKSLLIGMGPQLFLIAGLEEEMAQKLGEEVFSNVTETLPRSVRILPFDTLLRQFEKSQRTVVVLVPRVLPPLDALLGGPLLVHSVPGLDHHDDKITVEIDMWSRGDACPIQTIATEAMDTWKEALPRAYAVMRSGRGFLYVLPTDEPQWIREGYLFHLFHRSRRLVFVAWGNDPFGQHGPRIRTLGLTPSVMREQPSERPLPSLDPDWSVGWRI